MKKEHEKNPGKNVLWKVYDGKAMTLSEQKNKVEARSIFWKALLGEISPEELEKRFNNRLLTFSHLIKIHLDPIAIIHVLEKFLQNDIDERFVLILKKSQKQRIKG